VFYYVFSAFYIAELVGSFTAAVTIDISPWISCGLSMSAICTCLFLLWVMPRPEKQDPFHPNNTPPKITVPSDENTSLLRRSQISTQNPTINGIAGALSHKNSLLFVPLFFTNSLRHTILNILIQYGSKRFELKISTGALFYTETAIVNIFLFLFLVPLLSSNLGTKYNIQPQMTDLWLARTCVCLLCLGSLMIGLSPSSKDLPFGMNKS
jgi:hypothetical protein